MSLEDIVGKVKTGIKSVHDYLSVPGKGRALAEYATNHYLDDKIREELFDGKTDQERENIYRQLTDHIESRLAYHKKNLNSVGRHLGKSTGLAVLLQEVYHFVRLTPIANYNPLLQAQLYAKALMEVPTMYRHVKDTKDWYGAAEWLLSKPIALFIPYLGAAYDIDVVNRVIKKQAIREGLNSFLKEKGFAEEKPSLFQSISDRIKKVTGFTPEPDIAFA